MLIYIIYEAGEEYLVDVCGYSILTQSPTAIIKPVNNTQIILNDRDQEWFLCCSPTLLFLNSPLLLLEYTNTTKTVFKIRGHTIASSPLTLWDTRKNPRLTIQKIKNGVYLSRETGDLSQEWASKNYCKSPKAIVFHHSMPDVYIEMWNSYADDLEQG